MLQIKASSGPDDLYILSVNKSTLKLPDQPTHCGTSVRITYIKISVKTLNIQHYSKKSRPGFKTYIRKKKN